MVAGEPCLVDRVQRGPARLLTRLPAVCRCIRSRWVASAAYPPPTRSRDCSAREEVQAATLLAIRQLLS
jgi:hypothetical protein